MTYHDPGGSLEGLAADRLYFVPDLPAGQELEAELRLTPSGDIALRTRRFEQYLGTRILIPLILIITDVEAVWTDDAPE